VKLGVNIDHVATLRQARRGTMPEPVKAAEICEDAGCHSIVCHLREDRRHINDNDLRNLRRVVETKLNLEMSSAEQIVNIALQVLPDQATLVPERREEVTTEGGLDVVANQKQLKQVVKRLSLAGITVSVFIDPEKLQIKAAKDIGIECIELHTGRYANADAESDVNLQLQNIVDSAKFARSLDFKVFAGHGLNYENVQRIAGVGEIEELNIGHSIISHAVFVGLEDAVKQMLALVK
jgi:pyridoxine 5-phosphate synthase